jgi:hypothetical protein
MSIQILPLTLNLKTAPIQFVILNNARGNAS